MTQAAKATPAKQFNMPEQTAQERRRLLGDVVEFAVLLAEWNATKQQPGWVREFERRSQYLRWVCDYAERAHIPVADIKRNIAAGFTFVRCGSGEND